VNRLFGLEHRLVDAIYLSLCSLSEKKVQKPSLGLYLFKRENFCSF